MVKHGLMLAVTVVLASAGCVPLSSGTTLKLTEQENGGTATISVGTGVEVLLSSNASTGYSWQLADVDQAVLEKTANTFIPPSSTIPGASGQEQWDFVGRAVGQTQLRMEYRRPWESADMPAAQTFTVTITVAPSL